MKKLIYIGIILCVLFLVTTQSCLASHIVGGEVSYRFVSHNVDKTEATYQVVFTLYRDIDGIEFEEATNFGIYLQNADGSWTNYDVITEVYLESQDEFLAPSDPCQKQRLSEEKVESGTYRFDLTLPVQNKAYRITYQRCCRNHAVSNILNASTTGAVYDVVISPESQRLCNSSPQFAEYPPTFICVNSLLEFNHSAYDIDGDELRYSFCAPLTSGGPESHYRGCCDCLNPDLKTCTPPFETVQYASSFTYDIPILGNPVIDIDYESGIITGRPQQLGIFVIGLCVEEYRDGVHIGSVRRDFEFNVVSCISSVAAQIEADSTIIEDRDNSIYYFQSCTNEEIKLVNKSEDQNYIDHYTWRIYDEDHSMIFNLSKTQDRDINIPSLESGKYTGLMILNEDKNCIDSAQFIIDVYPEVAPEFSYDYETCTLSEVSLKDETLYGKSEEYTVEWIFENGDIIRGKNVQYQFDNKGEKIITQRVTDTHGCIYENIQPITWNPETPITAILDSKDQNNDGGNRMTYNYTFCHNEDIIIKNESKNEEDISSTDWYLYDQNQNQINYQNDAGISDLSLSNISSGNYHGYVIINAQKQCPDTALFNISIRDKKIPNFDYSYDHCERGAIDFRFDYDNNSEDVQDIIWTFSDGEQVAGDNISYQFDATGDHIVSVQITDSNGCTHASEQEVNWTPNLSSENPEYQYEEKVICPGDTILFFGNMISQEERYTHRILTVDHGCDSMTYELDLKVYAEPIVENIDTTLCPGEVYYYDGQAIKDEMRFGEIFVSESTQCDSLYRNVSVQFYEDPTIHLENTMTILPYQDYTIPLYVSGNIHSVTWEGSDDISCKNCLNPIIHTTDNQTLTATIETIHGCIHTRTISVDIDDSMNFYVPNIISTSDRKNNRFYVQSNDKVTYEYELMIYDRYGNRIHRCYAQCNDSTRGWLPENINPGVFVYTIFFKSNIKPNKLSGTITVLE